MSILQVLEPQFRAPYVNVNRWFVTCINQPQFKAVLGEVSLCTKMAQFDGQPLSILCDTNMTCCNYISLAVKKYNELFPKEKKEKTKKAGSEVKGEGGKWSSKKQKAKEPEPAQEEEEEDRPKPAKFVDPYVDLPKR